MATIKSYTDIEQSRKLAEILPLESADMCWTKYIDNGDITSLHAAVNYGIVTIDYPCWSLAALLDVLSNENMLVKTTDGVYYCLAKDVITKHYNNPIDACYEMILKFHRLNWL